MLVGEACPLPPPPPPPPPFCCAPLPMPAAYDFKGSFDSPAPRSSELFNEEVGLLLLRAPGLALEPPSPPPAAWPLLLATLRTAAAAAAAALEEPPASVALVGDRGGRLLLLFARRPRGPPPAQAQGHPMQEMLTMHACAGCPSQVYMMPCT
jgi:hypothetical protein